MFTGSGSLAAMAVFESGWKPNLSEEEGKKLVRDAIAAGIFNDLGSGSNVDLCVIRNSGPAQYLRTYEEANIKVIFFIKYVSMSIPDFEKIDYQMFVFPVYKSRRGI